MKKRLTTLFLLLLCSAFSIAQKKQFFGVQAGTTFSKPYGNEDLKIRSMNLGMLLGVTYGYNINQRLSFKTGLNYVQLASSVKANYSNKSTLKQNYLTLPITMRWIFDKKQFFYINTGPYFGLFIHQKVKSNQKYYQDIDQNNNMSRFDMGWSFGIGVKVFENTKSRMFLEFRDNIGFVNTLNSQSYLRLLTGHELAGKVYNHAMYLMLTWEFFKERHQ